MLVESGGWRRPRLSKNSTELRLEYKVSAPLGRPPNTAKVCERVRNELKEIDWNKTNKSKKAKALGVSRGTLYRANQAQAIE